MEEEYHGWTNRETWVVNLWLSNERATDERAREVAREAVDVGRENYRELELEFNTQAGRSFAADALKNLVEDLILEEYDAATMLSDLINSALARVNWLEIADAYLEGVELAEVR